MSQAWKYCKLWAQNVAGNVPMLRSFDYHNSTHLLWAIIGITFAYGTAYAALSWASPTNGLRENNTALGFRYWDSIYFSITTETTLGYGDITPVGWSRVLACSEVVSGLIIAGAIVSKITSLPATKMRVAAHKASGDWIEFADVGDAKIVSISTIAYANGSLRYWGDNYSEEGALLGSFTGEMLDSDQDWKKMTFSYTNIQGKLKHYSAGRVNIVFNDVDASTRWGSITGTCIDYGSGVSKYWSKRATPEESRIIHDVGDAADASRIAMIQSLSQEFWAQHNHHPDKETSLIQDKEII